MKRIVLATTTLAVASGMIEQNYTPERTWEAQCPIYRYRSPQFT